MGKKNNPNAPGLSVKRSKIKWILGNKTKIPSINVLSWSQSHIKEQRNPPAGKNFTSGKAGEETNRISQVFIRIKPPACC